MSFKREHFFFMGTIGVIFFLLCASIVCIPAMGKEENSKSTWVWTKERPKPAWWSWDVGKEKPVRGGYQKWASSRYIGLMNPNHWPVYDWNAISQMYDKIVYGEGDYKPSFLWLAESYEYLDPITCIMKFRKGIKFHDGTDFNAESVKYMMEWINDKKNGAWTKAWIEPVKSVEVVNEYTVKWHFKRPWAGFLGMLGSATGYPISVKALEGDAALKEIGKLKGQFKRAQKKMEKLKERAKRAAPKGDEKSKKAMAKAEKAQKKVARLEKQVASAIERAKGAKPADTHPVGLGKFMFEEGRPGNYLKLKRNPNWWFGKTIGRPEMPYPDGMIFTVIADPSVRLANLRAGQIHYIGLTPSQYQMLKNDPNLNITTMPSNFLESLRFNTQKGPCKDIRVRKAISHAIDRKALIHGIRFGQAKIASCMYPEQHWCHNPNLKPVTYNPELSKKLLSEAGYAKGLTIKGHMSNLPDSVALTEALKNMLIQVGIEWKVDALDNVAASDRMKNLEYHLAEGGFSYIKDPDFMPTGLYHPKGGFNYGRSNNEKAIALIEAGRQELDVDKRQKIYFELEKVLYENYEDAWLWWPISIDARRKNLIGYDVELHKLGDEAYWFSHSEWLKKNGE